MLSQEEIQALNDFVDMPQEDYEMMKVVCPLVAKTVDRCRKMFL